MQIVVGLDAQEADQTLQLVEVVLHRRAGQTPAVVRAEGVAGLCRLRVAVLDRVRLIQNDAVPVHTVAAGGVVVMA